MAKPDLVGCAAAEGSGWVAVLRVDDVVHCFTPQVEWQVRVDEDCPNTVENTEILMFSDTVLFGSTRRRCLKMDSTTRAEVGELLVDVLASIVRTERDELLARLTFDASQPCLERIKSVRLSAEEGDPEPV